MTPKPGQIRCPTCLRSTPPAAYCTQCGSPIPPSARVRPRGLDRDELEERVRRRPGEGAFRRGSQVDESPDRVGYVPFEPQPEDALAVRPDEEPGGGRYTGPPIADEQETERISEPPKRRPAEAPAERPEPPQERRHEPEPPPAAPYPAEETYDDRPYGEPEDAYAYPYEEETRRGGGGSALPIVGFVALCVLALAVGAVLAGLLGGEEPVGQATPSPSVASVEPSVAPSEEPSAEPSGDASTTPDPTEGPVTFPDGAVYRVQPCGTYQYAPDLSGCQVDGSRRDTGDVWILVIFDGGADEDTVNLALRQGGTTIDQQETVLGSIVDCGDDCRGLIWGAIYRDLDPGAYELVLRRNGDFADSANFEVEG